MIRQGLFISVLLIQSLAMIGQGAKQITSRGIKTVFIKTTEMKKGVETKKMILETYGKRGRLLESKEFNADSVCVASETFRYSRKGYLLEHETYDASRGEGKIRETFQYDKFNRDTLQTTFETSGEVRSYVRSVYNTMNQKVSESTYDGKNQLVKRTEFAYDKRGMIISRITRNAAGERTYEKVIQYEY